MQLDTGWSKGQRALLRFLEQQGILTQEPLAPTAARPTNADLFAAFAEAIDQQRLVDLVSEALRIAQVDLETFTPMPDLVSLIPMEVACNGEVVPIAQHDGMLEVAAANPLDLEMVKSVEFTTGLRVRTKIARREDVCRALADAYGVTMPEAATVTESSPEPTPVPEPIELEPDGDADTGAALLADDPVPGIVDVETVAVAASNEVEAPATAEPIRWSFDMGSEPPADASATSVEDDSLWDEPTPTAFSDEHGADEAGATFDGTIDDDPSDDADVPVYELDLSLEDDAASVLASFDDVRLADSGLEEPTPVDPFKELETSEPEPEPEPAPAWRSSARQSDLVPVVEESPEPVALAVAPIRVEAPVPTLAVLPDRPAVLVVSRDVGRRIALRDALEAATGMLCVLTMRDEIEARAVLGLGGIAVVVVEGGAIGSGGRPLWESLVGHGSHVVVWGGRPGAADVVAVDRDIAPLDLASRVRSIMEEALDG